MKKMALTIALAASLTTLVACKSEDNTVITDTGTTQVTETSLDTTAAGTIGDGVDNNQIGDGKDNNNIGDGKDNPQISPELKKDAKEAGQAVEDAARKGVNATGTALQKAGTELKKASKPGDQ